MHRVGTPQYWKKNGTDLQLVDSSITAIIDSSGNSLGGELPMTTVTDPALNNATSTSNIDSYSGIVITTTGATNNQTLQAPTSLTAGKSFTVVNNDTSTNAINVIDGTKTIAVAPGEAQRYIRDGSSWVAVEAVDATNITSTASNLVTATNVQDAINQLSSSDYIEMSKIGSATLSSVTDFSNAIQSAGRISGGDISDGGSGTIDIADIKGILKTTNSAVGANVFFDLSGVTGQALTDNSVNYIAVDYNAGTPQFVVGTTNTANGRTIFNLGKVYKEGTSLDIIDSGLNIYDWDKRSQQKAVEEETLKFVSGAIVSETGTRYIGITAGVMYAGMNRITTDSVDTSGADTFEYYYYTGAAWTESDQSQIDNTNYNDVASGLVALSANRYGVHWVYKGTNGTTYVIYGQGNYRLSQAQAAQPPSSLPDHVAGFGVLRAKIIIKKSDTTFTEIESVADTNFVTSTPANHNELGGLQGGTADQYYHLTSAEHTPLTAIAGLTPASSLIIGDGLGSWEAVTQPNFITNNSIATSSNTVTFTNKTFDANGTGNSITNIDVADLANGTDGELITWDASGVPATVGVGTATQVLTSNGPGAAPTFQDAAGGGLTWGDSINGDTSTTGLTLTADNSSTAGSVQKIVIGDTQTAEIIGLDIDTGADSSAPLMGIKMKYLGGGNAAYSAGLNINYFSSATQGVVNNTSLVKMGRNFNTDSAFSSYIARIQIEDNVGAGANNGIVITNYETTAFSNADASHTGLRVSQVGVGGTAFSISGGSNVNSNVAGLVNYTLSNTQSGASIVQKIDLGTSAQAHTGLLVNAYNANTSCIGIKVDMSTTGSGIGIYVTSARTTITNLLKIDNTSTNFRGYFGIGESNSLIKCSTTGGSAWGSSLSKFIDFSSNNGLGDQNFSFISYNQGRFGTIATAQTAGVVDIRHSRSRSNTSGTVADDFDMVYYKRSSATTGAGGTLTSTGSVMKLENVVTQTAGTLTDSATVLELTQDNNSTGGHILMNAYSGTPTTDGTFWFDGSDLKARIGGTTYTFTKS